MGGEVNGASAHSLAPATCTQACHSALKLLGTHSACGDGFPIESSGASAGAVRGPWRRRSCRGEDPQLLRLGGQAPRTTQPGERLLHCPNRPRKKLRRQTQAARCSTCSTSTCSPGHAQDPLQLAAGSLLSVRPWTAAPTVWQFRDLGNVVAPQTAWTCGAPQVVLSFYEKRVRQQWGLAFGKQEERLFWEQWCVTLAFPCFSDFQTFRGLYRVLRDGAAEHRVCCA